MALAIGGNSVNKAYLGSTEVQKMYLGSELVFTLSNFSIISYNISEETNTTAKVQVFMTEQCSINYYVNGIKNAVSSDDFNAGEIGPDEFRHTRTLTDLPAGQTSNLIIELTAESNLQVIQSENIPLTTTGEPAGLEIPTGIRLTEPGVPSVDSFPRLMNFRVEEANKDRILFDSTADASGLTDQGFLLSTSRTVTGVVLDGDNLGGYLTVSSDYTYWENDKVNLVGGDGTVLDFTYEHILSNIDEPVPTSERFVSISGGGDGLSIGSPYSFANIAGDNAPGRKFWIEKGNYGDIWANGTQGRFSSKNGTESAPMWLEGYTNTPGDIANRDILDNFTYTSMAQAEADAFDATTYPVFAGATEQVSSYGLYFRASSYWIVKNLQIKGFQDNILLGHATGLDAASNIQVRNCSLGLAIGDTGDNIGGGFLSGKGGTTELKSQNTRVTETLCIDNMAHGIRFHGARELAYDNAVYCGTPAAQYEYTTDYYFSLYGGSENGIIKNNYAARVIGVIGNEYSGHSYGTKGDAGNSNGLFDGNQALNIGENLFAAYIDTYGFVFKNNSVVNVNVSGMEGLVFRDGAHDCVWENNYIEGAGQGCSIWKSRENYPPDVPANDYAARNGIIRNNIFNGGSSLLVSNNKNSIPEPDVDVPHIIENIKFYNNTVYNFTADLFYFNTTNDNDLLTWINCDFKNNIVDNVANELSGNSTDDYDQQYNLYSSCGFSTPVGTGNVNTPDPDFTDIAGGDFTPLAPFINIQAPRLADALSGYGWEARQATTTLGAELSAEETPGVVVPTVTVSNTDGTADFSTVQAAIDSGLVAGDIVGLKGGDYFEGEKLIISQLNGAANNPITFTSYGTGKAILDVSRIEDVAWINTNPDIWFYETNRNPVRVMIDGTERLGAGDLYAELGTNVPDLVEWYYGTDGVNGQGIYIYSALEPTNVKMSINPNSVTLEVDRCSYLNFSNIEVMGGYFQSMAIKGCDNIIVDNMQFGKMCRNGLVITAYTPDFITYTNNTNIIVKNSLYDTGYTFDYSGAGTYAGASERGGSDGVSYTNCIGGQCYNNTFKNWSHNSFTLVPVDLDDRYKDSATLEAEGLICMDLFIFDNTTSAPDIAYGGRWGVDGNAYDNEFYNNTILNASVVSQLQGFNNNYHDNTFSNVTRSPLKTSESGAGLSVNNYAGFTYGNTYESNQIIDCEDQGIQFNGTSYDYSVVENNVFNNNNIINCGASVDNIGIVVRSWGSFPNNGDNNTFTNNNVYTSLLPTGNTIEYYAVDMDVLTFNTQTSHGYTISGNTAIAP